MLGLDTLHMDFGNKTELEAKLITEFEEAVNKSRSLEMDCISKTAVDFMVNAYRADAHKLFMQVSACKADFVIRVCEGFLFCDTEEYMACIGIAEIQTMLCGVYKIHELPVLDILTPEERFDSTKKIHSCHDNC